MPTKAPQAEPETKKIEPKAPEEPQEFLQKIATLKYPFADVFGIVKVIPRTDEDNLSLGFQDSNGRKEIVLTASKETWKKVFEDGLDYLKEKA